MSNRNKLSSAFQLLFFMCLVIGVLIYYDIRQQGTWRKSHVNQFLRDSGVWICTEQFFHRIKNGLLVLDDYIHKNHPIYRRTVIEFSEPYVELLGNFGCIFYNIYCELRYAVIEQYLVFIQSVEFYAPCLMEQSQSFVTDVWSVSTFYFSRSIDFLKKEVFVGQLSPENVQKVVFEVFNTTQNKASECLHWVYEKVQNTIK